MLSRGGKVSSEFIQQIINQMLEKGYEKQASIVPKAPVPKRDFGNISWETSTAYRTCAIIQLQVCTKSHPCDTIPTQRLTTNPSQNDFPFIRVDSLRKYFETNNFHYTPTLKGIEKAINRFVRSFVLCSFSQTDIQLFIQSDIYSFVHLFRYSFIHSFDLLLTSNYCSILMFLSSCLHSFFPFNVSILASHYSVLLVTTLYYSSLLSNTLHYSPLLSPSGEHIATNFRGTAPAPAPALAPAPPPALAPALALPVVLDNG